MKNYNQKRNVLPGIVHVFQLRPFFSCPKREVIFLFDKKSLMVSMQKKLRCCFLCKQPEFPSMKCFGAEKFFLSLIFCWRKCKGFILNSTFVGDKLMYFNHFMKMSGLFFNGICRK